MNPYEPPKTDPLKSDRHIHRESDDWIEIAIISIIFPLCVFYPVIFEIMVSFFKSIFYS